MPSGYRLTEQGQLGEAVRGAPCQGCDILGDGGRIIVSLAERSPQLDVSVLPLIPLSITPHTPPPFSSQGSRSSSQLQALHLGWAKALDRFSAPRTAGRLQKAPPCHGTSSVPG